MTRTRMLAAAVVVWLVVAPAWAQRAPAPASVDQQFDQFQQMLNGTADDVLAQVAQPAKREPEAVTGVAAQPAVTAGKLPAAVDRVRQLRSLLEPILRQEGVPAALAAVVVVESGGQATALSPKGARGLWQLMPETARRYGLVVTAERDERLDLVKSTRAAARYLRDLYAQFGNWGTALAAYNAGGKLVAGILQRSGGNDFQALSRSRRLPDETRTYVAAVLAAMRWFDGALQTSVNSKGKVLFAELNAGD